MEVKTHQMGEQDGALEMLEPERMDEIREKKAKAHKTLKRTEDPILSRKEELIKKKKRKMLQQKINNHERESTLERRVVLRWSVRDILSLRNTTET